LVARPVGSVDLAAAEALVDIADEARLTVFAVVDHIDAKVHLTVDDVGYGTAQLRRRGGGLEGLGAVTLHERQQIG
jgi:hypothetical protein